MQWVGARGHQNCTNSLHLCILSIETVFEGTFIFNSSTAIGGIRKVNHCQVLDGLENVVELYFSVSPHFNFKICNDSFTSLKQLLYRYII